MKSVNPEKVLKLSYTHYLLLYRAAFIAFELSSILLFSVFETSSSWFYNFQRRLFLPFNPPETFVFQHCNNLDKNYRLKIPSLQ